jgi:Ca2+-binding RTX toxin-like protein
VEDFGMPASILTPPDGALGDLFGAALALSADGRTAIIGGLRDDVGANADQGSARVMDWDGTAWVQRGDALSSAVGDRQYGMARSVALSADGNTALLGSEDGSVSLVFAWSGNAWEQRGSTLTPASAPGFASLGHSVALSADGSTLVLGGRVQVAPETFQDGARYNPAMQVFEWDQGGDWVARGSAIRLLQADDSASLTPNSVKISADGTTVLMSGVAVSIIPANPPFNQEEEYWQPLANTYDWKNGNWEARGELYGYGAELDSSDRRQDGGFGWSLDLTADGTTVIIGSPFHGVGGLHANGGQAEVHVWDGSAWQARAGLGQFTPTDTQTGDFFGLSVALSDDGQTAVLGGTGDDVDGTENQGSARVFDWNGTDWIQRGGALTPLDGEADDYFGFAVEMSADGNTVLVGGYTDDIGGNLDQGSARSFAWDGTQWLESGPVVIPASLAIAALSADKAEGSGGSTAFTFTVTRSGGTGEAASALWTVSGDGAVAADFAGNLLPSGTVSFAAGETSKTITILVAGDRAVEAAEGFTVTLSDATGASISTGSASGLIRNDDAAPRSGTNGADILMGTDAGDRLSGLGGDDQLDGGAGNDSLLGGTGNDTLLGGSGLDTLDGGTGADSMEGGGGDDAYVVDDAGDVILELAGGGHDRVTASLSWTLGAEVERLSLSGSGHLNGTGNALANRLDGNAGMNQLDGGAGNDSLHGLAGDDLLLGGLGLDVLDGGLGADSMEGGAGDDVYIVDDAGDVVVELAGGGHDRVRASLSWTMSEEVERLHFFGSSDLDGTGNAIGNRIYGNAGANVLDGAGGDDGLYGFGGNDRLIGGAGADGLIGGAGDDTMEGGAGNDTYTVEDAGDVLLELAGGGRDEVKASLDWTLGAEFEELTLTGSAALNGTGNGAGNQLNGNGAANQLDGGEGNDSIFGLGGADTLLGGAGKDRLEGGLGADRLVGGLGADRFVFAAAADANGDVIVDFNRAEGDRVDLRHMDTNPGLAGDQAFAWIGDAAFSNVAGQLRFSGGVLAGDMDGNGIADFAITMTGVASLTSAGIWL